MHFCPFSGDYWKIPSLRYENDAADPPSLKNLEKEFFATFLPLSFSLFSKTGNMSRPGKRVKAEALEESKIKRPPGDRTHHLGL